MWALLRLPQFRGATHASGHDNRSGPTRKTKSTWHSRPWLDNGSAVFSSGTKRTFFPAVVRSWRWLDAIGFLQSTECEHFPRLAALSAMERTRLNRSQTGIYVGKILKVRRRPIYLFCSQRHMSWSSTSNRESARPRSATDPARARRRGDRVRRRGVHHAAWRRSRLLGRPT